MPPVIEPVSSRVKLIPFPLAPFSPNSPTVAIFGLIVESPGGGFAIENGEIRLSVKATAILRLRLLNNVTVEVTLDWDDLPCVFAVSGTT